MSGQLECSLRKNGRIRLPLYGSHLTHVQYHAVFVVLVLECSAGVYISLGMVNVVRGNICELCESVSVARAQMSKYIPEGHETKTFA